MKKHLFIIILLSLVCVAQTVNNNILPATTGWNLGNAQQRWNAFLQNVDISGTITGIPTLSGNNSFTGSNTFTTLNNTCYADAKTGATADVKIQACITALSSIGIVDATGFGSTTQSLAATITIPSGIRIKFSPATKWQAASSALNLFIFEEDAQVYGGFTFDCANQLSYSGILFQTDPAVGYGIGTNPPFTNRTSIGDVFTTDACKSVGTGTALLLNSSTSTTGTFFISLPHWHIRGLQDGVRMSATSNGSVSGNIFPDFFCHQTLRCVHLTGTAGSTIYSNMFPAFSAEAAGPSGQTGTTAILCDGTVSARWNQFNPAAIWDYPATPINWAQSGCTNNLVQGLVSNSNLVVDTAANNYLWELIANTFVGKSLNFQPGIYLGRMTICEANPCSGVGGINFNGDANLQVLAISPDMYFNTKSTFNFEVNGTNKAQMNSSGVFAQYGGLTTAGQGNPVILGATSQKSETTTADANVLTVTPAAVVGTYRACFTASVSAATAGVIGWTLSYTDSNGNAQSNIAQSLFQSGTAAPALTFTTSVAGNYQSCSEFDTNNAAANIVVKWVGGGTTTAKVSATVERII